MLRKDVNNSISKKFDQLIKQIEDIDKDRLRLLAHDFVNASVKAWQRKNFDSAIEKAIYYLKKYPNMTSTTESKKMP